MEEFGDFAVGVVLDAFGFALDIFLFAFALLAESGQAFLAAEGGAFLEAVLVFGNHYAVGLENHCSLGDHDIAVVDLDFLGVVDRYAAGLQQHRLVAVGPFGEDGQGDEQAESERGKANDHGVALGRMYWPWTCDCRTKVALLLSIWAPTPVTQDWPWVISTGLLVKANPASGWAVRSGMRATKAGRSAVLARVTL